MRFGTEPLPDGPIILIPLILGVFVILFGLWLAIHFLAPYVGL